MKVAIHTLGCKVNQYETQAMERALAERGHTAVPFEEPADVYIVNTCTVTATSDKKSRGIIRGARKRNPDALVAVCGCYAQTDPEAVAALGVDLIGGSGDRLAFLDRLEELWERRRGGAEDRADLIGGEQPQANGKGEGHRAVLQVESAMTRRAFEKLPAGGMEGRTRAMLKVEDGCVNFCSYCIIPYARGSVRSLPPEDARMEAARLSEEGYREIVLTGIEISSWGKDLGKGDSLIDLVEAVCTAAPELRIRLGSLEPRTVTEEFCARAAKLHNLCPHFHLSLQSGCDATLKRMNRKYDTARYYESVELLRKHFDRPGITTDLIVGFPGESGEEFEKTLAFLQKCAFTAMHIFPYSRRAGTPAAKMAPQVTNAVKEDRARRAAAEAEAMEQSYLRSFEGETLTVLFEDEREGLWRGHAANYVEVRSPGEKLHNQLRSVKIAGAEKGFLTGALV